MEGGMRHHLRCPISLQPMQDPVTAPTGISYDRRAIERWLAAGHATCPVTGQPLALADLTPNHTLRRLIQSWSSSRTTLPPVEERERQPGDEDAADVVVQKLFSLSSSQDSCPQVASGSDDARRRMVDAGVVPRVLSVLVSSCAKTQRSSSEGDDHQLDAPAAVLDACLALLRALLVVSGGDDDELRPRLAADSSPDEVIAALTDVLVALAPGADAARASAVQLLESAMESASAAVPARLRPELFTALTAALRARVSPGAALRSLLHACPAPRNRALIVGSGAAHEAIELELAAFPSSTRVTELVLALLAELCSCADGRAALAAHPAGLAAVARRLLRVSPAAAPEVLREMARVGAVGKLCCVLQADCDAALKEAATAVLRMRCTPPPGPGRPASAHT